ncbi:MAG: serine--tRNA ligase [Defluviitaleaceae bacterium]|nr:serine--tRNA ligase [Defluviitaleaceae bacterium]
MLDARELRENFGAVTKALSKRGGDFGLGAFLEKDKKRRDLIKQIEEMKAKQNAATKQIPIWKKENKDVSSLMAEMKELSDKIKKLEPRVKAADEEIETFLLGVPNAPCEEVPAGNSDEDNVEIRRWGEPTSFSFEPKPHWELGDTLGILDPAMAAKTTGARFTFYKGQGARLERALINFMLDTHIDEHGYTETLPPYIVHRRSLVGTGQLPKFDESNLFRLAETEYFLNPTAEVPVTNMYREEILDGAKLPIKHTAYAPSFRAEAGAAGRDTRGLIRQHQFNKVEMVKFVRPENSYDELEKLTHDAEDILHSLGLPYRVVILCGGDLTFCSAKTYDIEVWMPSYGRYVEISSCSNFEAYQARRAGIRFKDKPGDKPRYVHTLNGSGLAVGRTTAAVLENFQREDGSVAIPPALYKYMNGAKEIR